ncbi:MAG: hypothetical protein NZL87_02230, partial [Thermomicrobium sp.]|nr:hypothetical protein [Thermomicrobium sp.]
MPESTSLAPLSVLERVCLEVEYLARGERVRRLRQRVSLLECEQHELRGLIEERLGTLQRDLEELRNEVQLLESRLRRLLRVAQPLTDEELDAAARREEPRVTDGDREAHRHHGSGRDNGRIESMV